MLDAYASGRSDATVLRLPPVYGTGMKGNLATLMRLADTGLPLPAGALTDPLADVIARRQAQTVASAEPFGAAPPVYVACDVPPVPIAAFSAPFGRVLATEAPVCRARRSVANGRSRAGQREVLGRMTATQICDPSLLVSEGWQPETDTLERLAEMARPETLRSPPRR